MLLKITLDPNLALEKYKNFDIAVKQYLYCKVTSAIKSGETTRYILEPPLILSENFTTDPHTAILSARQGLILFYAEWEEKTEACYYIDIPCQAEEVADFPSLPRNYNPLELTK
jgi:hypothetical protein